MPPDREIPARQSRLFRLAAAGAAALAIAFAAAALGAAAIMLLLAAKAGLAAAIGALAILTLGDVRHDDLLGLGW